MQKGKEYIGGATFVKVRGFSTSSNEKLVFLLCWEAAKWVWNFSSHLCWSLMAGISPQTHVTVTSQQHSVCALGIKFHTVSRQWSLESLSTCWLLHDVEKLLCYYVLLLCVAASAISTSVALFWGHAHDLDSWPWRLHCHCSDSPFLRWDFADSTWWPWTGSGCPCASQRGSHWLFAALSLAKPCRQLQSRWSRNTLGHDILTHAENSPVLCNSSTNNSPVLTQVQATHQS